MMEEATLGCPVPSEEILKAWDGASLEKRSHFFRAILETFSDARVMDDGQPVGLVEFSRLTKKNLCDMPKKIRSYIIMAYDPEKKIFNFSQAKRMASGFPC